jgi:hypothetical protein
MFRGPVRVAVLIVGLVLTIGAGYRVWEDEASLNRARQEAADADATAGKALALLLDTRASLHAYVAPGQGLPFWARHVQENIDGLRQTLVSLDGLAAPLGRSLSESLDGMDRLTVAERRARTYASRGEMLLAGDVIFTEVRDLVTAATNQVDSAGTELKRQHAQRAAAIRTEQITLVGAGFATWIVIALLLLPIEAKPAAKDPAEWRTELKETLSKPIPTPAALVQALPSAPAPLAPAEPRVLVSSVREVSEICADLSALSDPGALQGTLARVSTLLDATGLIVWLASNDGGYLSPVATHGFDATLVARIGKVPRDSANVTAAAFRENTPKVSAPTTTAPAALAVAMCSPSGPAGVLSIELKAGQSADEVKVALASIIAAQLATLTMPITLVEAELADSSAAVAEPRRAAL